MLQVRIKKKLGNFLLDVDFPWMEAYLPFWELPDAEKV